MHSKSDNIEIMISDKGDEVFDSLENRYQNNLEFMKVSELVFNYVHLIGYKYHKINLNHGGSYIDTSIIKPIDKKDNKCFQYAVTVVLN